MPELPEVEVVRRGLSRHVVGRTIRRATFTGARVTRRHRSGPQDLSARLAGARIAGARRRGKYLWLDLDGPAVTYQCLVIHLGMSGQLLVEASGAPREKHLHAVVDFADPSVTQLRFVDQRTFGGMVLADLVPDPHSPGNVVPEPVTHIAPDPLESVFRPGQVVQTMKRRESAVKRALLDQNLVSGIGNIYADEALWRAGLHGERLCSAVTRPRLAGLLDQAREVMSEALEAGGTSFDALYVNVNGASGYFDRSLAAYGQAGRPCRRCGTPIRREAFMGRSSYSCPRCQPRPRGLRPQGGATHALRPSR